MKPRACVMGHPVAHSRSPMLHGYWLRTLGIDGSYEFADVAPEDFENFFRNLNRNGYVGGNITQPHKQQAFRLVDRREPAAEKIGAVNTVWYDNGQLIGGNTDWLGIVLSLDNIHPGWDASPGKVVVLGAGGSARASVYGFLERGFSVSIVNRTRARAEQLAAEFGPRASAHDADALPRLLAEADLMINNTSLGMTGNPPHFVDVKLLNKRSAASSHPGAAPGSAPLCGALRHFHACAKTVSRTWCNSLTLAVS